MDIFTVIFTSDYGRRPESIPWTLSFADLELAKNHVAEEARHRAGDEDVLADKGKWEDYEEHSTYVQSYDAFAKDIWTIIRTELVEANPSGEASGL